MVDIGRGLGRRVSAVISDMNQPLGRAVGNALETLEAVDTLRGKGPADFLEHCLVVGEQMLTLGDCAADTSQARAMLRDVLNNGQAFDKLVAWIEAQGGDVSVLSDPPGMRAASIVQPVPAPHDGIVAAIDAMEVGLAAVELGAGRAKKGAPIDHAVGIVLDAKVGDQVQVSDTLFTVHANDPARCEIVRERVLAAYAWTDGTVAPLPLVYEVIT
jgi:pyrimidine-nucleoside phosphorylase